jgi:formylglycine-generating enzyme required for sulfatase activity
VVGGFHIDSCPVTNDDFAKFVAATGHVTLAETAPDPVEYPGCRSGRAPTGATRPARTAPRMG